MTIDWLIPTLGYVVAIGALGVVSKRGLGTLPWQGLILWMGIFYSVVVILLLALGQTEFKFVHDTGWAVVSASLVIGGLVLFYLALGAGEASKVVPISAAYPAVTLALSALVLSESLSVARVAGMFLVVVGVVVLTTAT